MTQECATTLCPSPCKDPKIFDLGIVVDQSSSIKERNFDKVRVFLAKLFQQYTIHGLQKTRVGIVKYAHGISRPPAYLMPNYAKQTAEFLSQVVLHKQYFKYEGGQTRTDKALRMANIWFFNKNLDRPQYPNVMIVFTDGKTIAGSTPYSEILPALKANNVRVIAVGIGDDIDNAELKEIAMGNEKHVVHIADFDHLIQNMDELLTEACKTT